MRFVFQNNSEEGTTSLSVALELYRGALQRSSTEELYREINPFLIRA
jgi:hypothetical protein